MERRLKVQAIDTSASSISGNVGDTKSLTWRSLMLVQQNAGVDDQTIAPAIMIRNTQFVSVQVTMDTSMNLIKQVKFYCLFIVFLSSPNSHSQQRARCYKFVDILGQTLLLTNWYQDPLAWFTTACWRQVCRNCQQICCKLIFKNCCAQAGKIDDLRQVSGFFGRALSVQYLFNN